MSLLLIIFFELIFFKGKVVIDAFRLTDPRMQALGQEPRQTTSNLGHLQKPSIQVIEGSGEVGGGGKEHCNAS